MERPEGVSDKDWNEAMAIYSARAKAEARAEVDKVKNDALARSAPVKSFGGSPLRRFLWAWAFLILAGSGGKLLLVIAALISG